MRISSTQWPQKPHQTQTFTLAPFIQPGSLVLPLSELSVTTLNDESGAVFTHPIRNISHLYPLRFQTVTREFKSLHVAAPSCIWIWNWFFFLLLKKGHYNRVFKVFISRSLMHQSVWTSFYKSPEKVRWRNINKLKCLQIKSGFSHFFGVKICKQDEWWVIAVLRFLFIHFFNQLFCFRLLLSSSSSLILFLYLFIFFIIIVTKVIITITITI